MSSLSEHEEQPEKKMDENKKLIYIPPILTILSMQEIDDKQLGVSENLSGSGLFSS